MFRVAVVVLLVFHFSAHGQVIQRSYFNKSDFRTDSVNSYWYMESKFSEGTPQNTSYYTATKKIRSKEVRDSLGQKTLYYHDTENLKAEIVYDKKGQLRSTNMFYPDGNKQAEFSFEEWKPGDIGPKPTQVLNYWDSAGHQIVTNGNGVCQCVFTAEEEDPFVERGSIVNKIKEGEWKGADESGKTFEEHYVNGKLTSGTMRDTDGTIYTYTDVYKTAEPSEGMNLFYKSIGNNLKYPSKARKAGIDGKVFVEFVVEKDGSLTGIEVIKGIGGGCDEEAVRVIEASVNWNPGVLRGKTVRQRFILPLAFRLQ